jgi:glycolate oxidase FAD binding subunit
MRAPAAARAAISAFHPEEEAVALLSRRVKEKFDPAGIFNPGKMAGY